MDLEKIIETIALKVRYSITRITGGNISTRYMLYFYGYPAFTFYETGKIEFPNGVNYYVKDDVELTQIIKGVASQFV